MFNYVEDPTGSIDTMYILHPRGYFIRIINAVRTAASIVDAGAIIRYSSMHKKLARRARRLAKRYYEVAPILPRSYTRLFIGKMKLLPHLRTQLM